jgi:hypothetical protein
MKASIFIISAIIIIAIAIIVTIIIRKQKQHSGVELVIGSRKQKNPERFSVPISNSIEPVLNFKEYPLSECVMTTTEQERFYALLQEVIRRLDDHQVVYWAASGTLLGVIRHGDVIPWDDDVDLAVVYDQENLVKVNAALDALRALGYPCGTTESGIKILDKDTLAFPWVDLLMVELGPDNRYRQCGDQAKRMWPQVNYNKEHIFPLQKGRFGSQLIWIPNQSESVLNDEFGNNWRTHMVFKATMMYDLRRYQENKNVPTLHIRDQINQWKRSLPPDGTAVKLHNVVI